MHYGALGRIRTPDPLVRSQIIQKTNKDKHHHLTYLFIHLTDTIATTNYKRNQLRW